MVYWVELQIKVSPLVIRDLDNKYVHPKCMSFIVKNVLCFHNSKPSAKADFHWPYQYSNLIKSWLISGSTKHNSLIDINEQQECIQSDTKICVPHLLVPQPSMYKKRERSHKKLSHHIRS